MKDIAQRNIDTLSQLAAFISKLSFEEYQCKSKLIIGASIGQHVRHIIEFYESIFLGIPIDRVCYDSRKRDVVLEEDKQSAFESIVVLNNRLFKIEKCNNIQLNVEVASNEEGLKNKLINTSVSRELLYALDHTIHHMAIIRIAGQDIRGGAIDIPEDFGVAPSTLRYRTNQIEQCAQ